MTMNRGIIRMTEGGKVSMPLIDVWMTKEEIADMFGLPEASVFRAIRSIYKKSELYEHETMQRTPSTIWSKASFIKSFISIVILQTDKFRRKYRLVVSLCRASGHQGQCA